MTYRQPFRGDYPITQRYGEKITSPCHTGIDFATPIGTEILASADGNVMFSGWDQTGYGFCAILRHDDGRATLYAHLKYTNVSFNEKVRQGDVIGISGDSGNVTGPHLHFEARKDWKDPKSHMDPMDLPLISAADIVSGSAGEGDKQSLLPEGVYQVACEYAFIRTWDTLIRDRILNKGEIVYVFPTVKYQGGLPFRFIGAGRCIAEHDTDGTKILEEYNGEEED